MTVATRSQVPSPSLTPSTLGFADQLVTLPLTQLRESKWNPRKHYDPAKLAEMEESLKKGQLAPIIVRPWAIDRDRFIATSSPTGITFEIGAGHRRFRSAPGAGRTGLLAIIRDMDDVAFLELLNIENKQRDDIEPLDEAEGFKLLMEKAGYKVERLAERIGLSKQYVYDRLKLLQLIPAAKMLLQQKVITAGHAILLARLTPTDQARAVGNPKDVEHGVLDGDSLLLEQDDAAEDELPLHDRVKPLSVREFQKAIQRSIRATPETTDPFLFPDSARALEAAKEEKLSVIHITREYLASDEVRQADAKQRVFGSQAWERADGQVDPYEDEYGERSKKRSKTCEWSRYGFVASGPGQGEVFKVCINKQKCAVHWPEHVKGAEQAAKRAKTKSKSSGKPLDADAAADQQTRNAAAEAREEFEREALDATWTKVLADRKADFIAGAKRRAQQLAKVPNEVIVALMVDDNAELYLHCGTEYNEQIEKLVWPSLPGKWSKGYQWRPRDATAGRADLGLQLFFALDTGNAFDATLDRAVETAMKATMLEYDAKIAAAAKKTEKKPAKKKPAKKKAKKGAR